MKHFSFRILFGFFPRLFLAREMRLSEQKNVTPSRSFGNLGKKGQEFKFRYFRNNVIRINSQAFSQSPLKIPSSQFGFNLKTFQKRGSLRTTSNVPRLCFLVSGWGVSIISVKWRYEVSSRSASCFDETFFNRIICYQKACLPCALFQLLFSTSQAALSDSRPNQNSMPQFQLKSDLINIHENFAY